jgi:hypothetical protein
MKTPICKLIEDLNNRVEALGLLQGVSEDVGLAYERLALLEVINKCLDLLSLERYWIVNSRLNGMHNASKLEGGDDAAMRDCYLWHEALFGESMDELFVSLTHGESEEEI